MRIVVINTGTELLLGDVINTHLAFIAREVFELGLRVEEQRTVPDGRAIADALGEVFPRAEIVFLTGGLGPTSDDITRDVVAEFLKVELSEHAEVREAISNRLTLRRIPMPASIWRQAQVPVGGEVLPNENGTAPGIYLPTNVNPLVASPHLFLLPGPPRELQPMFHDSVRPILRRIVPAADKILMRKFRIVGMGESVVEEKLGSEVLAIPDLELGYCARPGEVDVRVVGAPASVEKAARVIEAKLSEAIFSRQDEQLAELIVKTLSARCETLAIAESCTGGLLAHKITNVPGASAVFRGGFVTYSNEEKIRALDVSRAAIEKFGAVSDAVAIAMAQGALAHTGVTHAIATTGIAGPGGGTKEKPVGTVFVALASEGHPTLCRKVFFPTDRETFKELVAQQALDLLRRRLP